MSAGLIDVEAVVRAVGAVAGPEVPILPEIAADILPGDLAAACRLWRAALTARLRTELGSSPWGAENAAARIVGRAALEVAQGVTDPEEVARLLGVSRTQIDRDARLVRRLEGSS